jgi:hypothetical protein
MYHDYRLGHAQDLSLYGNHGTPSGDIWFANDGFRNRKGIATGKITVAASASINITTFTAIVLCSSNFTGNLSTSGTTRFLDKSDWYITSGDVLNQIFFTTSVVRNWALPAGPKVPGSRYIGMNCQDAAITPSYIDGRFAVNLNAAPAFPAPTGASLFIGNNSGNTRGHGRCMSAAMMFNRELTATEHARLYGELMK